VAGLKYYKQIMFSSEVPSLSRNAQQVLSLARKEAARFNHDCIETEHLLLALTALPQCGAVNVLQNMGLAPETVRTEIENRAGSGPEAKMVPNIPFTPRVQRVLAFAGKEARALKQSYVGTEHLLLGLLREGQGVAAHALIALGVNEERVRNEVLKQWDPHFIPPQPGASPQESKRRDSVLWKTWRNLSLANPQKQARPVFRAFAGLIAGSMLLASALRIFWPAEGISRAPWWDIFLWIGCGLFFLRVACRGY